MRGSLNIAQITPQNGFPHTLTRTVDTGRHCCHCCHCSPRERFLLKLPKLPQRGCLVCGWAHLTAEPKAQGCALAAREAGKADVSRSDSSMQFLFHNVGAAQVAGGSRAPG